MASIPQDLTRYADAMTVTTLSDRIELSAPLPDGRRLAIAYEREAA